MLNSGLDIADDVKLATLGGQVLEILDLRVSVPPGGRNMLLGGGGNWFWRLCSCWCWVSLRVGPWRVLGTA